MGQGVAGDLAPDPHVIELGLRHAQACLNIPEVFPVRQLGKGHTKELVQAGKRLHLVIAVVALDALAKLVGGNQVHRVSKHGSAEIHTPSPSAQTLRKYGLWEKIISNRKNSLLDKSPYLSAC